MFSINDEILDFIILFEGFKSQIYNCAAGCRSIGYGHVLKADENYTKLTKQEARELLFEDLIFFREVVTRNINMRINFNQFMALLSLSYNIGGAALQRSTLRQKINYGAENWIIEQEWLRWHKIKGKFCRGLFLRRQLELKKFCST
jgi:lysozyme